MKHNLVVKSLHDASAFCSCGGWSLARTGAATRAEIEREHGFHVTGKFLVEPCGDRDGDNVCDLPSGHYGKHMQKWGGGTMVWGVYREPDEPEIGTELDRQDLEQNGSICLAGNPTPGGDVCGFPGCVCGPIKEPETVEQEAARVFGECGGKCGEAPCIAWNKENDRKEARRADKEAESVPTNETIDLTPRGCSTPEGKERVKKALDDWLVFRSGIVSHLIELLQGDEPQPITAQDVYVLRRLIEDSNRKMHTFMQAVAGVKEANHANN